MRILMSVVIYSLCITSACASGADATGDTGQFHYRITQIDLAPQPGLKFGLQAMVGFEITNTGKLPVRVAIVPAWPTIQLEGAAVQLQMNWQNVSGLVTFWSNSVGSCTQGASDFTLLRPSATVIGNLVLTGRMAEAEMPVVKHARFTASLMVQSLDDKKCWLEPFSVRDVPVGVVR